MCAGSRLKPRFCEDGEISTFLLRLQCKLSEVAEEALAWSMEFSI